jgi:hypothetical protein
MVYSNEYRIIKSSRNQKLKFQENFLLTWPVLIPTDKLSASLNFIDDTAGKLEQTILFFIYFLKNNIPVTTITICINSTINSSNQRSNTRIITFDMTLLKKNFPFLRRNWISLLLPQNRKQIIHVGD